MPDVRSIKARFKLPMSPVPGFIESAAGSGELHLMLKAWANLFGSSFFCMKPCRHWPGATRSGPASPVSRCATNPRGRFRPRLSSRHLDACRTTECAAQSIVSVLSFRGITPELWTPYARPKRCSCECAERLSWVTGQAGMTAEKAAVVLPVFQRPEGGLPCSFSKRNLTTLPLLFAVSM